MFGEGPASPMLVCVEFVPVLDRSGEKWMAPNAGDNRVGVGVADCSPARGDDAKDAMFGSMGLCVVCGSR